MTESPAQTLRRAATALRADGRTFEPGSRKRKAYFAIADWLDAEADAHQGAMAVSEAACALAENAGAGQHRVMVAASTLDQALAVARAVLGEEADAA